MCLPSRRTNGHGRCDGGHMISLVAEAMDLDSVGRMWPFGNNLLTPECGVADSESVVVRIQKWANHKQCCYDNLGKF